MNAPKPEQDNSSATNITHIGSVTGQVHTGSGNINVGAFHAGNKNEISTREEFLEVLHNIMMELDAARQQGLLEEIVDDTTIEVEAAEREAKKGNPKPERIINRLENAKAILTASAGITTAAATVTNQLLPVFENIVHSVSKIFIGI